MFHGLVMDYEPSVLVNLANKVHCIHLRGPGTGAALQLPVPLSSRCPMPGADATKKQNRDLVTEKIMLPEHL